ncbi:MAG TPA: glycosyltransferase [Tepidisphaeraceae bacterium]|jgi:glycosyltransferase involved in cell wall biosynthesis|nr:glycosyltransferase [Tepidisphaeraceae bacterium]
MRNFENYSERMVAVHLAASPFFGGPERQMLGLASSLSALWQSVFISFSEAGKCRPFLETLGRHGFTNIELQHNTSAPFSAVREVADHLQELQANVLCCHGYKCDILGWAAARMVGIPVVAISRGWTAATMKVRAYETLDRFWLRRMDRVVCVSEGQATKVRRAGVPARRVVVIRNAIQTERFNQLDPTYREKLNALFPVAPRLVICAAGRLSPEKGFDRLVEAARLVAQTDPTIGFALFGDGPLRVALENQIQSANLAGKFVMPGFRDDIDRLLPHADLVVLPSLTEGLPNVALEASAAGVAVVATAVGGTPEIIKDGLNGYLVPPADAPALADRILHCMTHPAERRALGRCGARLVREHFTFAAQAQAYQHLFAELVRTNTAHAPAISGGSRLLPADPTVSLARRSMHRENALP